MRVSKFPPSKPDVILVGRIKAETAKAICLNVQAWKEEAISEPVDYEEQKDEWFPISQVTKIFKNPLIGGKLDELHVKHWIAENKGLV